MERKRGLDVGPEAGPDDGDPVEKKRLLLCVDFTAIASCEAAVARRYLTENAWEMERALNAYFEPRPEEGAVPRRPETAPAPGSCVDLTSEDPAAPTRPGSRTPEQPTQQEDGSAFSLITWNIDGLDPSNLPERAQGVCAFLALYSPDVVFLQEVTPPYYSFLKRRASDYTIITGHTEAYFTAIMLKKSRVTFKSQEIIPFPKTKMMRNLLCVHRRVCSSLMVSPWSPRTLYGSSLCKLQGQTNVWKRNPWFGRRLPGDVDAVVTSRVRLRRRFHAVHGPRAAGVCGGWCEEGTSLVRRRQTGNGPNRFVRWPVLSACVPGPGGHGSGQRDRPVCRSHAASVSGNGLCLMTSHLESTREHAQERMNQLRTVLKRMQEAPESATVIFAGDTNLRDREVAQCGGLPGSISDVWELLGRPKHCQYTWDTQANSNLGLRAVSKHRFDRIFLRAAADGGHLVPQSLDLLGLEKLDCGRFPSDHWGLLCRLDVIL
ncbi:tyrosyl-DNA phosphodiesterase 2 isoform X1 [Phyllostomus hastatus]|uniref:tyrosyl-DNA phosphodiesterase 2 isoform X1 n=1 Tax=Phyllostomus hastatus TaxID=9423 RepID=UPI001E6836F6|nr:tyrosyl-DNA phosphodiesterase 2 isoform X1 [Phyllostomus hastatus]